MQKCVEAHFICCAIWREFQPISHTAGFISTAQRRPLFAQGNVLIKNEDYKPSKDATASDPLPILQNITPKTVSLGHSAETFML